MADPMSHGAAILIVDDEPEVLDVLSEQLRCEGYAVTGCRTAEAALERLKTVPFAAILSDQNMPGMRGLELLARCRELQPHASRVLITGLFSLDTAISAINQGEIFRFLTKPWARAELVATLANAVQRHQLLVENEQLQVRTARLNSDLRAANAELRLHLELLATQKEALDEAHESLEENFEHSLGLCYRLINTFYPLLGARTKAIVEICREMARTDAVSEAETHVLTTSAWLHDIGLVGVKREVLHKLFTRPHDCTAEDWKMIRQHPIYSQTLAAFVDRLQTVGATVRAHHERFDGKGYPDALRGEEIPWTARCLAVAAAFVETGLPPAEAREHIVAGSGTAFDPAAVRLFFQATQAVSLPRQVRELKLDELQPGMRLAKGIFSPAGLLLIAENQELTPAAISKIRNHGLFGNAAPQRLLVFS